MKNIGPCQLLHVEDNLADADLVALRLQEIVGYQFALTHATSVQQACALLQQHRFEIVVTDLHLPDSAGNDTLQRLRDVCADVPYIVFSSNVSAERRDELLRLGASDCIDKNGSHTHLLPQSVVSLVERRRALAEQARLHTLLDANPDAILVVDDEGSVQFVNKAALTLFGRSQEDFIGERLAFSVRQESSADIEIVGAEQARIGEMRVAEIEWNGKPASMATIRDVTEQRRLAEHVRQTQSMRAVGQSAGGVTHNLHASVGSKAAHERYPILLQLVAREALRFLRAHMPHFPHVITRLQAGLPTVLADVSQMYELFLCLVSFATQETDSPNPHLEVSLTSVNLDTAISYAEIGSPGSYVRITIGVSGAGTDRSIQQVRNELFSSHLLASRNSQHTLALIRRIVEQHNGTMIMHHNGRDLLSIYLPAISEPSWHIEQEQLSHRMERKHILCVDDEQALVLLTKRMLVRRGYEVTTYVNPLEALQAFRSSTHDYDAVLTDLQMSGMSGLEFAQELRALRPDLPIIMISAHFRAEDEHAAAQLGIHKTLTKPASIKDYEQALEQIFRGTSIKGESTTLPQANR